MQNLSKKKKKKSILKLVLRVRVLHSTVYINIIWFICLMCVDCFDLRKFLVILKVVHKLQENTVEGEKGKDANEGSHIISRGKLDLEML